MIKIEQEICPLCGKEMELDNRFGDEESTFSCPERVLPKAFEPHYYIRHTDYYTSQTVIIYPYILENRWNTTKYKTYDEKRDECCYIYKIKEEEENSDRDIGTDIFDGDDILELNQVVPIVQPAEKFLNRIKNIILLS